MIQRDVRNVIEGLKVLSNVGRVIVGFITLFGLISFFDLGFPEYLKFTFDFPEGHNEFGWAQAECKRYSC